MKTFVRFFLVILTLLLSACSAAPSVAGVPTTTALPEPPSRMPAATASAPAEATATSEVAGTPTPTFAPIAPTPTLAPLSVERRQALFKDVWTLVRDRYVYEDYRGLDWEAIRGEFTERVAASQSEEEFYDLMRELIERLDDDHSAFLSPQDVAREQAEFSGTSSFGGIGVQIREEEQGALVTDVASGGPAEQAGIQRRELITKIEGQSVADAWSAGENPMLLVRGEPGTEVTITVRGTNSQERDVTLTRRVISSDAFPAVQAERLPGGNTGLLRLDTFNEDNVDKDVKAAIESLLASGPLDGLIIDVRDNGGGRVDFLLNTVALFLDGGAIGSDSGRSGEDTLQVPGGQTIAALADTPVAILTGPDSVSAAEIFAAGMQARGRATIVGEPSAGNTEVLLAHNLLDGSTLRLAERAYRRPDGSLLEGKGVQPDVLIPADWWTFAPQDDPQILAAQNALKK